MANDEEIKRHTIHVEGMSCNTCEEKIENVLKNLKGVKDARANHHDNSLELEYDLWKINLHKIEEAINSLGYKLEENFWRKLKKSWINFCEENELDHHKTVPRDLSHDPKDK